MKISLMIVGLFIFGICKSQNLVPNGSFEDAWSCPYGFTTTAISKPFPGWYNPNKGTPDYFNICSDTIAGVPKNFAGNIFPADGVAYAGIILRETYDDTIKVYRGVSREYLQTQLLQPLNPNKLYCVKLSYANAVKSMFSVDAMGITLTAEKISTKDAGQIIQMPQVINKPGNIMSNSTNWQELCGIYRAKGNEKYLTIGNFWDNYQTAYSFTNSAAIDSNFFYAYYYIDDVRVFEIENAFECGCQNNNSYGSDWMSENFDPETGYDSKINGGWDIGENTNFTLSGVEGNNNSNLNNSNNSSGTDSLGNIIASNDSLNGNNNPNGLGDNNSRNLKESEISTKAFDNAKIGDKFNLNRIFFEFNSSELLTASFSEMDRLFEILAAKPSLRIEIRGHTDNVGTDQYNKTLSIKRAAAVYDYLISKGIDKARMKYRGFGNKVPVADNETDEGRSLNRRVEIIIVEL
jgi:outer membrane protein OmpA-like peptidoglycan-associated protein